MSSSISPLSFRDLAKALDDLNEQDGFLPERIGLARRMMSLDPLSESHRTVVQTLERLWHSQVPLVLHQAQVRGDSALVELIGLIYQDSSWLVLPPPDVLGAVEKARTGALVSLFLAGQSDALEALTPDRPVQERKLALWTLEAEAARMGFRPEVLRHPRIDGLRLELQDASARRQRVVWRSVVLVAVVLGIVGGGLAWIQRRSEERRQDIEVDCKRLSRAWYQGGADAVEYELADLRRRDPELAAQLERGDGSLPSEATSAVGRLKAQREAEERHHEDVIALVRQVAVKSEQDLTVEDAARLERCNPSSQDRAQVAEAQARVQRVLEQRTGEEVRRMQGQMDGLLKDGLVRLGRADGPAVAHIEQEYRQRIAALTTKVTMPVAKAVVEAGLTRLQEAVAARHQVLAEGAAMRQEVEALEHPRGTLTEHIDAVQAFLTAHPSDSLAASCTGILERRSALLAAADLGRRLEGLAVTGPDAGLEAAAQALRAHRSAHPEAWTKESVEAWLSWRSPFVPLDEAQTRLHGACSGPLWEGYRTLSVGDRSVALPAGVALKAPARFGKTQVLELPILFSLEHLLQGSGVMTVLRLEESVVIGKVAEPAQAALARDIRERLANGTVPLLTAPLDLAQDVLGMAAIEPQAAVLLARHLLEVLPSAHVAALPPAYTSYVSSLKMVPREAYWLEPQSQAAKDAAQQAQRLRTGRTVLGDSAKVLVNRQATLTAPLTPPRWIGVLDQGHNLALRPGELARGRLVAFLPGTTRNGWTVLGTFDKGKVLWQGTPPSVFGLPVFLLP